MTLDRLNSLGQGEFVEVLGGVFEHSPWVAERVWIKRPFSSLDQLWREMTEVVDAAPDEEHVALLRAHPDWARARVSQSSTNEQAGAGLNALDDAEYEALLALNRQYRGKFDFPFIFAVKGSGKSDILLALMTRLDSTREEELRQALWEVGRIARFRIEAILNP